MSGKREVSITADQTNLAFCRTLLSLVMDEVRPLTTSAERKAVWVYHFGRGHWECQGLPDGLYWHGSADSAYDARAKGWQMWLDRRAETHNDVDGPRAAPKKKLKMADLLRLVRRAAAITADSHDDKDRWHVALYPDGTYEATYEIRSGRWGAANLRLLEQRVREVQAQVETWVKAGAP